VGIAAEVDGLPVAITAAELLAVLRVAAAVEIIDACSRVVYVRADAIDTRLYAKVHKTTLGALRETAV
jgi:hypothetical protein